MRRLLTLATAILVLGLVLGVAGLRSEGVTAQENLEARVADLEARVEMLESRVGVVPVDVAVPGSGLTETANTITITGSGNDVSDPFVLEEGSYVVAIGYEGEGVYGSLDIKEAPGSSGTINYASLMSLEDAPYAGESLVEVYDAGEFVLVADGDGAFTVVIELP